MRKSIFDMEFNSVYPLLVKKAERKGRTREEVDELICWLTGYQPQSWDKAATCRQFFENAPSINPAANLIKGTVCGIKVEEIEDPLMQKIRWLDKLIDELAKGKPMEKIKR